MLFRSRTRRTNQRYLRLESQTNRNPHPDPLPKGEGEYQSTFKTRGLLLAVTQIEHVHRVRDPEVVAGLTELHLQLQRAAGVAGDDRLGLGLEDVFQLALAQLSGHLRLSQVVAAGRSAANLTFIERDEFEAGASDNKSRGCSRIF